MRYRSDAMQAFRLSSSAFLIPSRSLGLSGIPMGRVHLLSAASLPSAAAGFVPFLLRPLRLFLRGAPGARAIALRLAGRSWREIRALTGVSQNTVRKWLAEEVERNEAEEGRRESRAPQSRGA